MHPKTAFAILATATTGVQGYTSSNNIQTSYTDKAAGTSLGDINQLTTIQKGVSYWLAGLGVHNVWGNIDNYGRIVISQSKVYLAAYGGLASAWSGSDINNGNFRNFAGASLHVTDDSSISGAVYGWLLNSMQNDGSLQFCGRGDEVGSLYSLYCRDNCVNNGLISFEQIHGNNGFGSSWRNYILTPSSLTPSQTITNNGAFLIRNQRVDLVQNYLGTGCWIVGQYATMYMQDGTGLFQNPNYGETFAGQSISFSDDTGVIHMDPHVYLHNYKFGAMVYGFQAGNVFEFFDFIKDILYSGEYLTVSFFNGYKVQIDIGTGYDSAGFSTYQHASNYGTYNAVRYTGSAPSRAQPGQCLMTMSPCAAVSDALLIDVGTCTDSTKCSGTTGAVVTTNDIKAAVPTSTTQSTTTLAAALTTASTTSIATGQKVVPTTSASSSTTLATKKSTSTSSKSSSSSSTTVTSSSKSTAAATSTSTSSSSTSTKAGASSSLSSSSSTSTKAGASSSSSSSTSSSVSSFTTSTRTVATTTSSQAAAVTTPATFYLQSSCDGSCLGHFAADGQIYSNTYSSGTNDYDSFYINGTQLWDYTLNTLCVASENAGSETRFQCSNDLDSVNGKPVVGGFGLVNQKYLTYQSSTNWYGCGVLDLDDNYEPNGLTYSTKNGDPSVCRSCSLLKVTDVSQCSNQNAATPTTASNIPAYTNAV
ncbi:protein of unknown function [Taphrina deformans PYCC 5710]|uniref:Hyphally-regulated cell wall protein N-terminal domain-containing protein n=1 Tax=Taphrina deformans (strain PYCC 5710 / ATCC 11124 / CBS 356.35 / IMI 108563 / JCM 9778 / NBRC 8474) TaxID=1097556 RepID=R4XD56_TAPDE|nr:protein of unknown function [Taphrina deformans PYCC 5710]|eukprot:CCG83755.1 protein of unknown function [Taphrina deformans PYCC 5710]